MRLILLILLILLLIGLSFIIIKKFSFNKPRKILVVLCALLLFIIGGRFINYNYVMSNAEAKVQELVDTFGDSVIKTDGDVVYINIDDNWYDVSKISIVGKMVTDDIVLRYDGKDIKISQSGVVSVIKTLEEIGIIDNKQN